MQQITYWMFVLNWPSVAIYQAIGCFSLVSQSNLWQGDSCSYGSSIVRSSALIKSCLGRFPLCAHIPFIKSSCYYSCFCFLLLLHPYCSHAPPMMREVSCLGYTPLEMCRISNLYPISPDVRCFSHYPGSGRIVQLSGTLYVFFI